MKKPPETKTDPFYSLKYIAYIRSGLPHNVEDLDDEAMLNFAKWQICKVRNVLWGDPIWDSYTAQEILIEYFTIRFDESDELRAQFEKTLIRAKASDIAWFEAKERQYKSQAAGGEGIINEGKSPEAPIEPIEFDDKY